MESAVPQCSGAASPQVSFGNGRIEEFYVACNCLSAEQMAEQDVSRALAAAMSSFHFASLLHLPPEEATDPQVRRPVHCRCRLVFP